MSLGGMWTDGQGGAPLCPHAQPGVFRKRRAPCPAITSSHLPHTHFTILSLFPTAFRALMPCGQGGDEQGAQRSLRQARPHIPPGLSGASGRPGERSRVLSQAGKRPPAPERGGQPRRMLGPHEGHGPGSPREPPPMQALWQWAEAGALQALLRSGSSPSSATTRAARKVQAPPGSPSPRFRWRRRR